MRKPQSESAFRRYMGFLMFLLALFSAGCGGGTYGTGGGSNASAILRSANGTPIEGAIIQGVGSAKSYTSGKDGSVKLPLNESFPLSPIRIMLIGGDEFYLYVNTDEALAGKTPIIIEFDNREGAMVETSPETDPCPIRIDSWKAGIAEDGAGLSTQERDAISRVINNNRLQCEEKLQQINAVAFNSPLVKKLYP